MQVEGGIPLYVLPAQTGFQAIFLSHYQYPWHMIRVVEHRPCQPAGYERTRRADCIVSTWSTALFFGQEYQLILLSYT